jgi:hypothetical protein
MRERIPTSKQSERSSTIYEHQSLIDFFALLLEWAQEENVKKESDHAKQNNRNRNSAY